MNDALSQTQLDIIKNNIELCLKCISLIIIIIIIIII
jgi:hypothetical protein